MRPPPLVHVNPATGVPIYDGDTPLYDWDIGTTYYVSPSGKDSNSGLSGQPWLTAQKAADTVRPGDDVVFASGIYAKPDYTTSGNRHYPIRIRPAVGATVRFRPSGVHAPVFLPIGTVWTDVGLNQAGNSTIWQSPVGSVPIDGTGGLMRIPGGIYTDREEGDRCYWFARNSVPANPGAHGVKPWYYYDEQNQRIKLNQPTDPSDDEWAIVSSLSVATYIEADWLIFGSGLIFEFAYTGAHSRAAKHIVFEPGVIGRYCGQRCFSIQGEALAPSEHPVMYDVIAHTAGEHGVKATCNVDGQFANVWYRYRHIRARNCGYHGVHVSNGANHVSLRGGHSYNNGRNPCGRNCTGTEGCAPYAGDYSSGQTNDDILWEDFESFDTPGLTLHGDAAGLALSRGGITLLHNGNVNVRKFHIHDKQGSGIVGFHNTGSGPLTVHGGTVERCTGWGGYLRYAQHGEYRYVTFKHNETGQIYVGPDALDLSIHHCTIESKAGQTLVEVAQGADVELDYNTYISPDPIFKWHGVTYDNFEDYQTASEQDANSTFSS